MTLKLFNTLTRKREPFKSIKKDEAGMYTCGPTVYNYPHLGNYRAYLVADLLKRYLKYRGFKVKQIMNITDVDDKTIRDSRKEKVSLKLFTQKYEKAFFEDLKTLNIEEADVYPKATEHIKEMVEDVKILLRKGFAYRGDDGSIYYSVSKFKKYGKLAHLRLKELKAGARVRQDEYEKEQANDFALWKARDKADGDVFWETKLGNGRPGWHIECSTMSKKYLGKHFDIHTGGIDLVFPHHENEIAQAEAVSGEKFVNYWVHNEWLLVEGKKMSKSLGNFYTLRDVLEKGYEPLAVRYALMSVHYRQQLNFTFEELDASANAVKKLRDFMLRLNNVQSKKVSSKAKTVEKQIKTAKECFEEAMDDDLNISSALGCLFSFVHQVNAVMDRLSKEEAAEIKKFMFEFDEVLGLRLKDVKREKIPKEIIDLAEERLTARKNKDWKKADELREKIKMLGYIVGDTKEGYEVITA
ncbi:MAG: cysteine--tRNA ligase [Nanoarchaeota archaeon]